MDGTLPIECTWKTVVLFPKINGGFSVIGLTQVLCKTVLEVIKWHVGEDIVYHDVPHSLYADRGTGTASLEAKLLQQLMEMREDFLYKIFLDLRKAYDALDW